MTYNVSSGTLNTTIPYHLKYWYGYLQCAVRWNNALGNWFSILSGVRQGGVGLLSPVLFCVYIDDLITDLKLSRYGANVGNIFAGCLLYADDIVLLSPTCHGLQKLINACEQYNNNNNTTTCKAP